MDLCKDKKCQDSYYQEGGASQVATSGTGLTGGTGIGGDVNS